MSECVPDYLALGLLGVIATAAVGVFRARAVGELARMAALSAPEPLKNAAGRGGASRTSSERRR